MSKVFENPITMDLPMEIPESLYQLIDILSAAGFEAFIAGGAVRDTILGRSPKDYDISTSATPQDVVERLGPYVKFAGVQGEKSFMVARLVAYDGNEYEFAPYRSDEGTRKGGSAKFVSSIREDVMRRDLTINALFYKVPSLTERKSGKVGEVVDYVGGIEDIENEVVRTVGNPEERFNEDRLRILRAFRFAGRVDGKLDADTAEAIRKNNSLTSPSDAAVSEERIKEELIKGVVSSKIPSNYLNMLIDFDLFSQILPGLRLSRAFSSSRNIAVQLSSILTDNAPNEVEKTLFNKKFGTNISSSVKFLLNLLKLDRNNVVDLKKEYNRIKKSSNMILNDKVILDWGTITGKSLDKFLSFASAPPAVSAKDLIAGGMKPGPDIGRAIRDAEISAYFEENSIPTENISEAKLKVIKKLAKLSIILDKIKSFPESSHVSRLAKKFASVDYGIPKLSGHVYIFDMDDTLFWSPEWHNLAQIGDENKVYSVNDLAPNILSKALELVNSINADPGAYIRRNISEEERALLKEEFDREIGEISLEKDVIDIPWLGKVDQTVFVMKDIYRKAVTPKLFKKFFSGKTAKLFDLRGKYIENAVVIAGDHKFYQTPQTLGHIPNEDILNIYNRNSDNAVILTARESFPGMKEGIINRILSVGATQPIHVFTKPQGESSGLFKGHVIGGIAEQSSVSQITFFDDNLKYISSVNKVLEESYSRFKDKVSIKKVDVSSKPHSGLLKGDENER